MIYLKVRGASCTVVDGGLLTTGMVGAKIEFAFDSEWDALTKEVFYSAASYEAPAKLTGTTAEIPPEVLQWPGVHLLVGVRGKSSGGTTVIPTVYADLGEIKTGAGTDPGARPPVPGTPPPSGGSVAIDTTLTRPGCAADAAATGRAIQQVKDDMPQGSSVAIDTTLTKPGQAADAKATGDALQRLEDLISGQPTPPPIPPTTIHTITYHLTKASSSNRETSVVEGKPYTTTLTAADGLLLSGVSVTMGGKNITEAVWSAPIVSIPAVTGDVVITAAGVAQIDTSPVIDAEGIGINNAGRTYKKEGWGYTKFYPTTAKQYTYLYTNKNGIAVPSANATRTILLSSDAPANPDQPAFSALSYWAYTNGVEAKTEIYSQPHTGIRATLVSAEKEDMYLYETDTGRVIFAGKNTPYYGMENVNGAQPEPGTVSKAKTVDLAYSMDDLTQSKSLGEYGNLPQEFVDMVKANYAAFEKEAFRDFNKIPFIVHTDQHAQFNSAEPAFKLIGDLANWFEISACLNLGDTCGNAFNEKQLETYFKAVDGNIPYSKRVECYGNHDVWVSGPDGWIYTAPQGKIAEYLKTIYAHRESNNGYFTVVDPYYRVKYLVISDYEYAAEVRTTRMSPQQCDFLVRELSANDGLDVIICSHQPLDMNKQMTTRDPDFFAFNETFLGDKAANDSFLEMLKARHDKTAGTFIDSDKQEHPYDFSKVTSKLLCSFHGHEHFEAYYTLPGSITEFVFDYFKPDKTFYWGYVDRKSMKLVVWKNATDAGNGRLEVQLT